MDRPSLCQRCCGEHLSPHPPAALLISASIHLPRSSSQPSSTCRAHRRDACVACHHPQADRQSHRRLEREVEIFRFGHRTEPRQFLRVPAQSLRALRRPRVRDRAEGGLVASWLGSGFRQSGAYLDRSLTPGLSFSIVVLHPSTVPPRANLVLPCRDRRYLQMFDDFYRAINAFMKKQDWYIDVSMHTGGNSLPWFTSLGGFWPGLQVRSLPPRTLRPHRRLPPAVPSAPSMLPLLPSASVHPATAAAER